MDSAAERLLRHDVRAAILAEVCASPGILLSALAANVGYGRATIRHHVAKLHRAGLLNVVAGRQRSAVFPTSIGVGQQNAMAALKRGRTLEFVRQVVAAPGLAQTELSTQLNMSRKVMRKYVTCLLEHQLVEVVEDAPYVTYYPTSQLREALAGIEAAPPQLANPLQPGP